MIKANIDKLFALIILIILCPALFVISFLIFSIDGLPILYIDKRMGRDFKLFKLFKFKSMIQNDGCAVTSRNDPRITVLGNFIRKYKLDEFPQLINILIGDMVFVGLALKQ